MIYRLVLLSALILLPLASKATEKPSTPVPGLELYNPETSDKVATARRLIQDQRYQPAAALLESLYEEAPESELIYNMLNSCYSKLGQWNKLEEITRRFIILYPQNYRYHLMMADALGHLGRTDKAVNAYSQALDLVDTIGITGVNMIFDRMIDAGQAMAAVHLIDSIRQDGKYGPRAFAYQKARIFENERKYSEASDEYFTLLDSEGRIAVMAEQRLHALLDFPESSKEVEAVIMARTLTEENARAFKLLTNYYLKANDYEQAALYAVKNDSAEGYQGHVLLKFMRDCKEKKLYRQSIWMGDYIRRLYSDKPNLSEVYFLNAEALTEMGRLDEAIALYDSLTVKFPVETAIGDALYHKGRIYLDRLHDFDKAVICFDSVTNYYPRGSSYILSHLAAPLAKIGQGNLQMAAKNYRSLQSDKLSEEIREEIDYYLGLIDIFNRRYDSAQVAMQKLIVDYPRGFYVNDALDQILVIEDAAGSEDLLNLYSEALLCQYQAKRDSAEFYLEQLASGEENALADLAVYRLGMLYLIEADTVGAMTKFDLLEKEHEDSYYLPFAMKNKADIFALSPDKMDEAMEIYKRLLQSFSDYRFIPEVRKKIRQLNII